MNKSTSIFILVILAMAGYSHSHLLITSDNPILKKTMYLGIDGKVIMWGKKDTMKDQTFEFRLAEPEDGCEPYSNPSKKGIHGFFIRMNGKCSLGTKIHNAQAAGAAVLMIEYERNDLDEIEMPDHLNGKCLSS